MTASSRIIRQPGVLPKTMQVHSRLDNLRQTKPRNCRPDRQQTSTANTHSWNETEVHEYPPKTGGSLVRRIFNKLEENGPPRASECTCSTAKTHARKVGKTEWQEWTQVPVSKLGKKIREEPSYATSCNSLHSFVNYSTYRLYSDRT